MFYIEGVGDGQNFSFVRTVEGRMEGRKDGRTHRSTYKTKNDENERNKSEISKFNTILKTHEKEI